MSTSQLHRYTGEVKPVLYLLACYFCLRLLFQQFTILKLGFIYPTGVLVDAYYDAGVFANGEWQYWLGSTQFTLGGSCSGTTFFSLLLSFFVYRHLTHGSSLYWFACSFPIAIVANTIRVASSIEAHRLLVVTERVSITETVHLLLGTLVFLGVFIVCALVIENPATDTVGERQS